MHGQAGQQGDAGCVCTFPDVKSMAAATVEELYPMVKSCGFKSKAGNMIEACRLIMLRHGGEVPGDMAALTAPRRRAQDGERRAVQRWRSGYRGRYARLSRQQPASRTSSVEETGAAATAGDPAGELEPGASLADLPWSAGYARRSARRAKRARCPACAGRRRGLWRSRARRQKRKRKAA